MGVWNINATTDLIASMAQSTVITDSNALNNLAAGHIANETSDYAKILAEKVAEIDSKMNNTNGNSANNYSAQQQAASSDSNSMSMIETLRRIMPDGTLRIVTYKDGQMTDELRIKPHVVVTPDYSAPPTPDGQTALNEEKRLSLAQLLMA